MDGHSKLPYFMRMHGSVTPRMILPLAMIGGWATCITCISMFVYKRTSQFLSPHFSTTSPQKVHANPIPNSRSQHPPPHSPRFRSWPRALLPQHNRLRAILGRTKILGHTLRAIPQSSKEHLGTHRRAARIRQRRPPIKNNRHQHDPRLRRIPKTQTPLRAIRALPRHQLPRIPSRHVRPRRTQGGEYNRAETLSLESSRYLPRNPLRRIQSPESPQAGRPTARKPALGDLDLHSIIHRGNDC